jgi:hypothetical protein
LFLKDKKEYQFSDALEYIPGYFKLPEDEQKELCRAEKKL